MKRIKTKLSEKNAETLLEVVISIALFSMMALMVASMFGMANKVSLRNLETDKKMDENISAIIEGTGTETEIYTNGKLTFQKADGSYAESGDITLVKNGALYTFR